MAPRSGSRLPAISSSACSSRCGCWSANVGLHPEQFLEKSQQPDGPLAMGYSAGTLPRGDVSQFRPCMSGRLSRRGSFDLAGETVTFIG